MARIGTGLAPDLQSVFQSVENSGCALSHLYQPVRRLVSLLQGHRRLRLKALGFGAAARCRNRISLVVEAVELIKHPSDFCLLHSALVYKLPDFSPVCFWQPDHVLSVSSIDTNFHVNEREEIMKNSLGPIPRLVDFL